MNENQVIIIPEIKEPTIDASTGTIIKKKVAAYARVSTDFEDQQNSFEVQQREYKRKILANPAWEFVGLYADEGISGTSLKKRVKFNEMIKDALDGKIDLILVKSISRFARNTVDCIKTKRDLEEKGVEVFFEKENISSLDSTSETMLTIYASFAQEESRQISTNVTWGIEARMREGSFKVINNNMLGYDVAPDGTISINEEQAETVKMIYQDFLIGFSYRKIIEHLKEAGRKNAKGEVVWKVSSIASILSNEKYCGDVLYQKTYTKNYLTHKAVKNEGGKKQYLCPEHHPPIIPKAIFMYVQTLRRQKLLDFNPTTDKSNCGALSGLVYCAECGRKMGRTQYYRGKPYEKVVLTCKRVNKNKVNYINCEVTSTIDYDLLESLVNELLKEDAKKVDINIVADSIFEAEKLEFYYKESERIKSRISQLEDELTALVTKQVKEDIPIKVYQKEYESIQKEIVSLKESLDQLEIKSIENNKNEIFNRVLNEFLSNNSGLSSKLVFHYIKRIYRLKDNSILIIKSKKPLTDNEYESIRENRDSFLILEPKVYMKNEKAITYRIIEMEGTND